MPLCIERTLGKRIRLCSREEIAAVSRRAHLGKMVTNVLCTFGKVKRLALVAGGAAGAILSVGAARAPGLIP